MDTETIELKKCYEKSGHSPSVSVTKCSAGYRVSVWGEWGDSASMSLSFVEAEKFAELFLTHITPDN